MPHYSARAASASAHGHTRNSGAAQLAGDSNGHPGTLHDSGVFRRAASAGARSSASSDINTCDATHGALAAEHGSAPSAPYILELASGDYSAASAASAASAISLVAHSSTNSAAREVRRLRCDSALLKRRCSPTHEPTQQHGQHQRRSNRVSGGQDVGASACHLPPATAGAGSVYDSGGRVRAHEPAT